MPILQVSILEGRSSDQLADLAARLTSAAVESLGVEASQVRVLIQELPATHWAVGGKPKERIQ